ncbi:gephyrin-like molybdotransferase Glp [Halanaerobium sp.]|uniref:molybdopterin molybdotransferase MoeA n=1 Tax=Halanaerobium sp. TaxID=1895664 RepID=UPI000DE6D20C|nr:gephyrin-like molybdotransferase Glp [Halanaerobium sp.]PUU89972.1 MAG: molybdopterin molybdotransferase [Halanaerobium sp.]
MSEFLDLNELETFWNKIKLNLKDKNLEKEKIALEDSLGRICGEKIKAKENLPPFSRSTVDGFAIKAGDSAGASAVLPTYFEVIGEVEMGEETDLEIGEGEAAAIPTGGMLPKGVDAVLMVEYTEYLDDNTIETSKAVAAGENVVLKGEDIEKGKTLFADGHRVRPRDIGAMAGLGITEFEVYKKPKVAVISTGDELVEPGKKAGPGEIKDINSFSITSLLSSYGAKTKRVGIVKDEFELLKNSVENNLDSDLVLISGGSSVGIKDMTIKILNSIGEPGVLLHGLSIKPGKPTILAVIDGTPVIGLPGHPASAWTVTRILLKPIIQFLIGEIEAEEIGRINKKITENNFDYSFKAELTRNVVSDKGREEYIPVRLFRDNEKLRAEPILGKSSLITTLVRGDALIRIDTYEEGKNKGEMVKVELIEPEIY